MHDVVNFFAYDAVIVVSRARGMPRLKCLMIRPEVVVEVP